MEIYYFAIVVILVILAISDLIVGVSNDAVNFLNSAVGSKAAPFKIILLIAALGIIIGATFSSGMMEVARKGIFHPDQFAFSEIMIIFLAVMLTDIILLDLFNTFGLPTSTTVSIVFELLGAAVGVSIIKLSRAGDSISNMGNFINSSSALAIISGILISVAIAFVCGIIIQYLVRLLFSFNYEKTFKYFGAFWGGIAITLITYFILIKGAKGSSFMTDETISWIMENSLMILGISFVGWTLLLQILHMIFQLNILKLIVLVGTFALAMAFAGNDLVNFIGVPLAGLESFNSFSASTAGDPALYAMTALKEPIRTPTLYLLIAGIVMVIALWTSKKARSVTKTEINLGRQDDGYERFDSSFLARNLVRGSITINRVFENIIPKRLSKFLSSRFDHKQAKKVKKQEGMSFDLVRASVNLVVASALISFATSLKLPLSTTYVTFMVAMGSSLADGAWGRESAVYRVSGVITVIGGWFLTAFSAFTLAFILAILINWGGIIAIGILIILVIFIFIKTYTLHKRRDELEKVATSDIEWKELTGPKLLESCNKRLIKTFNSLLQLYDDTITGLIELKRKKLKQVMKEVKHLNQDIKSDKNNLHKMISKLHEDDVETGYYYVQVLDYLKETANSITHITQPVFEYIDNNHPPLSEDQRSELTGFNNEMTSFFKKSVKLLKEGNYKNLDGLIKNQKNLLDDTYKIQKRQLKRLKRQESGTKNSVLYIGILNESKNLLLHSVNMIKAQKDFLEFNIQNDRIKKSGK
ncbi:MAG: hypothetical protein AMS27_05175 [Bacteroides sp. SM23_62_1]|nr:MAG: hypothetical protein AMS27_05175 [Bacteroides sp. SM23_62_1]